MLKNQKLYPTALLYVLAVLCFLPVNANAQIPGALVEREDAAHGHPDHGEHVADTGMNPDPLAELALLSESNKELLGQIKQLEAQLSSMESQLQKASQEQAPTPDTPEGQYCGNAISESSTQCITHKMGHDVKFCNCLSTHDSHQFCNEESDRRVTEVLIACGVH